MAIDIIGDGFPLSVKGDIATSDGTVSVRIPVGTNDQILTATSSATAGLEWTTAPAQQTNYMEAIAYSFVSANVTTVTFDNIPQTYKDLKLIWYAKGTSTVSGTVAVFNVKPNNITTNTTNFMKFGWYLGSNGTTGISDHPGAYIAQTSFEINYLPDNSSGSTLVHNGGELDILNYSSTSAYKPLSTFNGYAKYVNASSDGYARMNFGDIRTNSAITRLDIIAGTYGIKGGSSWFALYGIKV